MNLIKYIDSIAWDSKGDTVLDVWRLKKWLSENTDRCVICNASLKEYWHKLTPGLVKALAKAYAVVSSRGENHFDKKDLDLSHSEYGNFQKLRFHGLIAKYRVDGQWEKGAWLITHRAGEFLQSRIQIPARVKTFRNKVIDHDDLMVTLKDVMGSDPYFETEFDWSIFKPTQLSL